MRSSFRVGIVLVAVLAMTGCYNRGENLPLEVAMTRVITPDVPPRFVPNPPPALIPPTEVVRVDGQLWQASAEKLHLPARSVQRIGSAGGHDFYALSWDSAPFDRLLVPVQGQTDLYQEYLNIY